MCSQTPLECALLVTWTHIHMHTHTAHILSKQELKVVSDVLAAYSDEKLRGIKQSIQERQSGSFSLEEVERSLQQSGKADVASRLREKLEKGDTLLDAH